MTQSNGSFTDLNDNGLLDLDVYFDFLCPYSFQASQWVLQVNDLMGPEVMAVRWKFFSLEQNRFSQEQPGWNIWNQKPDNAQAQGLLPFLAGSAALHLGGETVLGQFYSALGKMRHEEGLPVWEQSYIEKAWQEVGLDGAALQAVFDGSDRSGYEKLQQDHTEAVERYGAFGTPTLVFEEHRAFYFKLMPRPAEIDEALELFQHVQRMAMGFGGAVYEFKRPTTAQDQAEISALTDKSTEDLNVAKA